MVFTLLSRQFYPPVTL